MKTRLIPSLCIIFAIASGAISEVRAQSPAVSQNISVMAGKCELVQDPSTGGITKYVGDCYLERQNESNGAVSSNNPSRRLYCFNDYKLTANSNGSVIGGETADSWIGCSMCVGERCESFLIPGFPNDATALGVSSPVKQAGFNAAADPVVQSLPDGTFMVSFLAFVRGSTTTSSSAPNAGIFLQPIVDLENTEGDPLDALALLPQVAVALTNEQLVDKPDLAFIPTTQSPCVIGTVSSPAGTMSKSIPCGKVFTAFTTFNGQTNKNARSKINLCTHDLSGNTKDGCVRADESQHVDSGVSLATDPGDRSKLYLFWRRFATPNLDQTNAIVLAASADGGATLGKASVIFPSVPFADFPDLPQAGVTNLVLARSTSFVSSSVASLYAAGTQVNPVYVCWSQRNATGTGEGQIVCSVSNTGGGSWSTPLKLDPHTGGQFQPAVDCAAGQCSVAWYDLRDDLAKNYNFSSSGIILPADLIGTSVPHHTVDVRMAQWQPSAGNTAPSNPCYSGTAPTCTGSFQVSKYPITMANINNSWTLIQLQVNPLNPLTNCSGTCAFFGDYLDVFYPKWVRSVSNGAVQWKQNADSTGPRDIWLSWTGNNQVRFPSDGNWTSFTAPIQNGQPGTCDPSGFDRYGLHNQDIFTARVTPNTFAIECPRCQKPLASGLRTFLLILKNVTAAPITLKVDISSPTGIAASFQQNASVISAVANISPFGEKTRTVFANCTGSGCSQPITIWVTDTATGNSIPVLLNGASTIFPENTTVASEVHDLTLLNAASPNLSLLNYDASTLSLLNLSLLNSPDNLSLLNLSLLNGGLADLSLLNLTQSNLSLLNYDTSNLSLLNLSLLNTAANLSLLNNSLNLSLLNSSVGTKTWEIAANTTNTTSGYDIAMLSDSGQVPSGFDAFVVVTRTRPALSFDNTCHLTSVAGLAGQEILGIKPLTGSGTSGTVLTPTQLNNFNTSSGYQNLSLLNMSAGSINPLGDSTYAMGPGDKIQVTLVVQNTATGSLTVTDVLNQLNVFSTAQAASSNGALSHTPAPQATLTITEPASVTYGTTGTAKTSGGSGTGAISFSAGASTGCSIIASTGVIAVSNSGGSCVLTATKAGDSNYYPATSAPFTVKLLQANQAALTITGPASVTYGTTGTATTSGGSGAGTISFSSVSSTGCSIDPSSGVITVSDASGSCSLTATKAADSNYLAVTSASYTVTLAKAGQATFTITGPSSVTYGTTPTATTSGGSGTGAITFSAGASPGCSIDPSSGVITVTNATGTCVLTATKAADNNYNSVTSAPFTVTLLQASQAALTVSGSVTVTYGSTGTVTAGGGSGTGAITFSAGNSTGCSVGLTTGQITVTNASGTCVLTATKAADNNYTSVTSAPLTIALLKASTTITVSASSGSAVLGQAVTLTATVTPAPADGEPVTFYAGATNLGTAVLSGGSATLTTSLLALGANSITASYAGDNNLNPSSSSALAVVSVTLRFDGFYPKLGPAALGSGGTSLIYGPFTVGSTVALKWALFDANNQFYSGDINATTGQSNAKIELATLGSNIRYTLVAPGTAPGATVFRIDLTKPQYIFNWDTSKALTGTGSTVIPTAGTYILIVTDVDGGVHSVTLQLK